jgi:predicted nicotinamide N-methyase
LGEKTVDRDAVDLGGPPRLDPMRFIQDHMRIAPAPGLPEILLYGAHPASGLWRLVGRGGEGADPPPSWAYHWAGGTALARHILDRPETVAGLSVLDLGAGSGCVAIAAAKAGARAVLAADIDPNAIAAIGLNAAANNVAVSAISGDLTAGAPPAVDLIAVGDLFYERELAHRVTAFLDLCLAAGVKILVGDPYRAYLPLQRLRLLAEYAVADFGDGRDGAATPSAVFAFEPKQDFSAGAASQTAMLDRR